MIFSLSSSDFYPVELLFGTLIDTNDNTISLPNACAFYGEWGREKYKTEIILGIKRIHILYYSIIEARFYEVDIVQDYNYQETEYLILGLAPYGFCQLWKYTQKKQSRVSSIKATECTQRIHNFFNQNIDIKSAWYGKFITDGQRSDKFLEILDPMILDHFHREGLPDKKIANLWMKQFNYRYVIKLEKWDNDEKKWRVYEDPKEETELWFLHESLFDGTLNKSADVDLFNYHSAGKPHKIRIKWSANDFYYNCFIWFDETEISNLFNSICEANPDAQIDITFHFDYTCNKYQISFYRYGLKQPILISENAYQILVFKEMTEFFISDNFNQEQNAWYW